MASRQSVLVVGRTGPPHVPACWQAPQPGLVHLMSLWPGSWSHAPVPGLMLTCATGTPRTGRKSCSPWDAPSRASCRQNRSRLAPSGGVDRPGRARRFAPAIHQPVWVLGEPSAGATCTASGCRCVERSTLGQRKQAGDNMLVMTLRFVEQIAADNMEQVVHDCSHG